MNYRFYRENKDTTNQEEITEYEAMRCLAPVYGDLQVIKIIKLLKGGLPMHSYTHKYWAEEE